MNNVQNSVNGWHEKASLFIPVSRKTALLISALAAVFFLSGCEAVQDLFGKAPSKEEVAASHFSKGKSFMQAGDLQGAEEYFRRTLTTDPHHSGATLNLAYIYYRMGDDSRALLELGSAERLMPESVEIFMLRGEIYFNRGQYARSMEAYKKALLLGASHQARRKLIASSIRAGDISSARLELELLRGVEGTGASFISLEGMVMAGEGNLMEARVTLEYAARNSSEPGPHSALGGFFLQQGDYDRAIDSLRRAVDLGGGISIVRQLAGALIDAGMPHEASSLIEPYLENRSRDPLMHSLKARALIVSGQYEPALRSANRALELNPRLAHALLARGSALEGIGDMENAILAYRMAVKEAPHYTESYRLLAGAYRVLGRDADAFAVLDRLIKIDPSDRRAAIALLDLCLGNTAWTGHGLAVVNRLIEKEPEDLRWRRYRRQLQAQAPSSPQRREVPSRRKGPEIIRGR